MKRTSLGRIAFATVTTLALLAPPAPAQGANSFLTVMTRNMDEGTDFGFILAAAGNLSALQAALGETFCEVVAVDHRRNTDCRIRTEKHRTLQLGHLLKRYE